LRVLVSLHDVTPAHQSRLDRAERLIARLGVREVAYLFVPHYHGIVRADHDEAFIDWCRRPRDWHVTWALHGLRHREDVRLGRLPLRQAIARRLLTDGEGEFLALSQSAVHARLATGGRVFESCLGVMPRVFVAPAWLYNEHLLPALVARGYRYAEDRRFVQDLGRGVRHDCPAITWSSRSGWRRALSGLVTRELLRRWSALPAIRVALHPLDFDHPQAERSIDIVLGRALEAREPASYDDLGLS
jgi:predicted deacetylase